MPLYDFACETCGERFEAFAAVGAPAPCPACGAPDARRLLTSFAGPMKLGLRGGEARRADAQRTVREEQRREHFARQRAQREAARESSAPPQGARERSGSSG